MADGVKVDFDKMIRDAQKSIDEGTDEAAKKLITIGTFMVTTDLLYRASTMEVKIKLPQFDFANIKTGLGLVRAATDLVTEILDFAKNIDVEIKSESLWPWWVTCVAAGAVVSGVSLLIANHPEWFEKALAATKSAIVETLTLVADFVEEMDLDEDTKKELVKVLLPVAAGGAGGAAVVPALMGSAGGG